MSVQYTATRARRATASVWQSAHRAPRRACAHKDRGRARLAGHSPAHDRPQPRAPYLRCCESAVQQFEPCITNRKKIFKGLYPLRFLKSEAPRKAGQKSRYQKRALRFGQLLGLHNHKAAAGAFVHKLDHAAHLGKKRVILAPAHIRARLNASAALANNDSPAGNKLPAKSLYSQALCIGVAPVS